MYSRSDFTEISKTEMCIAVSDMSMQCMSLIWKYLYGLQLAAWTLFYLHTNSKLRMMLWTIYTCSSMLQQLQLTTRPDTLAASTASVPCKLF